jgi:hypothetical protein
MAKFTAVTSAVKSLSEVETCFGWQRSEAASFFAEWQSDLPDLSNGEASALVRMRDQTSHQAL